MSIAASSPAEPLVTARPWLDSHPVDRTRPPRGIWAVVGLMAVILLAKPAGVSEIRPWGNSFYEGWGESPSLSSTTTLALVASLALAVARPKLAIGLFVAASILPSVAAAIRWDGVVAYGSPHSLFMLVVLLAWPWWWGRLPFTRVSEPARPLLADALQQRWLRTALLMTFVLCLWGLVSDYPAPLLVLICLLPAVTLLRARLGLTLGVIATALTIPQRLFAQPIWPLVLMTSLVFSAAIARSFAPRVGKALLAVSTVLPLSAALGLTTVSTVTSYTVTSLYGNDWVPVAVGMATAFGVSQLVATMASRQVHSTLHLERRTRAVAVRESELSERARLARDLHDVVAHHVSLIAVRAETAPYTHPTLDPSGRQLLADIAVDARRTLEELRGVLGLLRRTDVDGSQPETAPLPGADDLLPLIERNEAIGMTITLSDQRGPHTGLAYASGRGHVIYRVLQEALTNARRHAPGEPVLVVLADTAPQLVVVNTISGPGSAVGTGTGLIGVRERVEALGGEVVIEDADQFRLEVHFRD